MEFNKLFCNNVKLFSSLLPFLSVTRKEDYILATVLRQDLNLVLRFLIDSFLSPYKVLTYIAVVDYPLRTSRFDIIYDLLTIVLNHTIQK